MTTTAADKQIHRLTDAMIESAKAGDLDDVYMVVEELLAIGREQGKNDLLIELHDLEVIDDEAVETAIANSGCADPRK